MACVRKRRVGKGLPLGPGLPGSAGPPSLGDHQGQPQGGSVRAVSFHHWGWWYAAPRAMTWILRAGPTDTREHHHSRGRCGDPRIDGTGCRVANP